MSDPDAACRLTLHVLDVSAGRPAVGMVVLLVEHAGAGARAGTELLTDADGRAGTDTVARLAPGPHELRFAVGAYYGATPSFYDEVPVRFVVGAADEHVHLALLVSPWSYTTYRGS